MLRVLRVAKRTKSLDSELEGLLGVVEERSLRL